MALISKYRGLVLQVQFTQKTGRAGVAACVGTGASALERGAAKFSFRAFGAEKKI